MENDKKLKGIITEVKATHPIFGEIILRPKILDFNKVGEAFALLKKALENLARKNRKRLTAKRAKQMIKNYYEN